MSKKNKTQVGYTLKSYKIVIKTAFQVNPVLYILNIFFSVVSIGSLYISMTFAEYIVNSAYNLYNVKTDYKSVFFGIVLFTIGESLFLLTNMTQRLINEKITLNITKKFESELNQFLGSICWDYYESHKNCIKIHNVKSRTLGTILNMHNNIVRYITAVPMVILFGYYLFQINIFAVLIYIIMVAVFNTISSQMYSKMWEYWDEAQEYSQRQGYFFSMCGNKITHQEFKFNRLFSYVSKKWENLYDEEFKINLKIFKNYEITLQTARIIFNIPYIMMLIITAYEISIGKHEIGFFILANNLFNNIIGYYIDIQSRINKDRIDSKSLKEYSEVMSFEQDSSPEEDEPIKSNISFNNVYYTYPQSETPALQDMSFEIKQGEKVAIVGVNGSGKTTMTNILMNLTKSFDGSLTDGEHSINLNGSISCILQNFEQYQMTIRENIEMGNSKKEFTDEEIWNILDLVGLKDFVHSLNNSINTNLGQLDNGIEFSKGQWQRLAIARLLANSEATIWILDEPTAYLDPLSEVDIYNMIYKLSDDRTVLFISHRLGFARQADKIILFNKGKVEEQGDHKTLLSLNHIYADMYRSQESWYI